MLKVILISQNVLTNAKGYLNCSQMLKKTEEEEERRRTRTGDKKNKEKREEELFSVLLLSSPCSSSSSCPSPSLITYSSCPVSSANFLIFIL